MKIGFDAKRAFCNKSGLGYYSRNTLDILKKYFPKQDYTLYSPSNKNKLYSFKEDDFIVKYPKLILDKFFPSFWRSKSIIRDLKNDNIDIFHGLSNELPIGIEKSNIKSIVTIHDLIFLRYPEYFKRVDRMIYAYKFKNACLKADSIIAISDQTKKDIIDFYKIPEDKIEVVYQGCNHKFSEEVPIKELESVRNKFLLPKKFILDVGTIEPRKNMRLILEAYLHSNHKLPIVLVGRPTEYINSIKSFISDNYELKGQVFFLHGISDMELRTIYQLATLFVYPSFFEGFGIPILEALCSKLPVICSGGSCFEETAGNNSIFFDPNSAKDLAIAIDKLIDNPEAYKKMQVKGWEHAQNFTEENVAKNLMKVYKKVANT